MPRRGYRSQETSPQPRSEELESLPGLRVYKALVNVTIRLTCQWEKPKTSTGTICAREVVCTKGVVRLHDGRVMGKLEDDTGWIPLFNPSAPSLESVYCQSMPIERGYWRYSVSNGDSHLALRSRPDSSSAFIVEDFAFSSGSIVECSHRVVGAHGNVYVKVIGYPGWLFESRQLNGKFQQTLIPLTFPEQSLFTSSASYSLSSASSSSTTSSELNLCSVREAAAKSNLREVLYSAPSRVISFASPGWPKGEDSYRVNIFYTTGTVSTVYHKKQLFRRNVSLQELQQILVDPRAHSKRGYYTAAEIPSDIIQMGWEFDIFHKAHTEQQTLAREEAKRQKELKRIVQRGRYYEYYMTNDAGSFTDNAVDIDRLKGLCFAGDDVVLYHDDESACWNDLVNGRLYSLLKGRGGDKTDTVDLLAISLSPEGNFSYYVRFTDVPTGITFLTLSSTFSRRKM